MKALNLDSNTKNLSATIRWFDAMSGEGMVRLTDGTCVYIHFTAIEGISKNNQQWPTCEDQTKLLGISGQRCIVDILVDTTFKQVSRCFIPEQ